MSNDLAVTHNAAELLRREDLLAAFAAFLRLNVAEGDASAATVRTYWSQVRQYVAWCRERGLDPALASEHDLLEYRAWLAERYTRATVATKLAAVRRLYQAAVWRGMRADNPAAGLKAPKEKTAREERVKFLPLEGLKRLLQAPQGDGAKGRRDRAMLALMGVHGLRVSEVAGLDVDDLDLDQGRVTVTGKGRKTRTVYLTEQTAQALAAWLEARDRVAAEDEPALFVSLRHPDPGTRMSARSIRYLVDGYLERLGLKGEGISCHSLRHSAATWARAGGAALDAIAGMLGHSSVTTTQVYARIVDRMTENPARYLEALLG